MLTLSGGGGGCSRGGRWRRGGTVQLIVRTVDNAITPDCTVDANIRRWTKPRTLSAGLTHASTGCCHNRLQPLQPNYPINNFKIKIE